MDPKNFYEKIGVEGLSSMTSEEKTVTQIKFLQKFISRKHKILDVGCGYGRITIPLARMGYLVEGIDLSPNLLEKAKKRAKTENIKLTFKVGDMRSLPYKDERFDIVICMWSTFSYMLTEQDQTQAINEMYRVLAKNGTLIIDLPAATGNRIRNSVFLESNVLKEEIMGIEHTVYLHTKETLDNLLKGLQNIKSYEVKYQNVNGRRRLFVFIEK